MHRMREQNYDLLRIVAAFSVVLVHVTNVYFQALTDVNEFGFLYTDSVFLITLIKALTRFSVPCFFMLSGAFLLADIRNADMRYFYRKELYNVGVDALVFSAVGASSLVLRGAIKGDFSQGIMSAILALLKGTPSYPMWYLSVLAGLYVITPYLIRLSDVLSGGGGTDYMERKSLFYLQLPA